MTEHLATPSDGTVAIVATGAIGASWAAHFLAHGWDVVATDPADGAESALRTDVERFWPALETLGLAPGASPDRLRFTTDTADLLADAVFVQENGPERLELKQQLFAELDARTGPEVVLASSSSGLMPSDFQASCRRHPERVLIGHPFNPPHLIPLVEVVGGRQTSDAAITRAMDFYRAAGKKPIHLRREQPGHVVNRLQAALWREAYAMVDAGAISVADLDTAMTAGPGLRWALLGPFATQHVSGGPGGIAHILEHLGPPMVDWWHDLAAPDTLTDHMISTIVDGVDAELADRSTDDLVAERDAVLVELLRLRNASNLP